MKKIGKIFKGDTAIWWVFFLLTVVSLIAVYSSIGLSAIEVSKSTPLRQFIKHLLFVGLSYIAVLVVSNIPYRKFSLASRIGYIGSIGLLAFLLFMNPGGGRWMQIKGTSFQPSEIAKIALIIYMARQMATKMSTIKEWSTFRNLILTMSVVAVLILPENFSTAALVCLVCFLMMLFAGVNTKYWTRTLGIVAILVIVGLTVSHRSYLASAKEDPAVAESNDEGFLSRRVTWGHRIHSWIHPDHEELTQENMARMAIARGGFFGKGIGKTIHARLMSQAHNDFIFAIIIEETGMFGGLIVFLLYSTLYFRCIKITFRCRGTFGALIVAGLGTSIYIQALVNMSVAVGLIPVTGQTLPFISAGGTSYLFSSVAIGAIQAVANDTIKEEKKEKEKKITDETNEAIPADNGSATT